MAMDAPRRTSARLRARTGTTPGKAPSPPIALESLIERDESPENEQSLNRAVDEHRIGYLPGAFESDSFLATPTSRPGPSRGNIHPSKIHQSTTKKVDTGLLLGFSDIKNAELPAHVEHTPSKSRMAQPGFEFTYKNKENTRSAEIQRIMDETRLEAAKKKEEDLSAATQQFMAEVREQAAKIKEEMVKARDEQARQDADIANALAGRKIAQPRSRFSDAHKMQFSKMDSIANHPSVARTKKPLATYAEPTTTSLKRTQSKADLQDERPTNPAPNKRAKASGAVDVSAARPVSRDGPSRPVSRDDSGIPRPQGLPAYVTTPTKASLARSASVKSVKSAGKIPTLQHSQSSLQLASPKKPVEDGPVRSLFGLKKSISMKSILSKPQPKYSDDPIKIAAGTHLPLQVQAPGTPSRAIKRVEFATELTSPTPVRPSGIRMPNKVLTPFRRPEAGEGSLVGTPTKATEQIASTIKQTTPELMQVASTTPSPSKAAVPTPTRTMTHPVTINSPSPSKVVMAAPARTMINTAAMASPSPRKIIAAVSRIEPGTTGEVSYPQLKSQAMPPSRPGDFTFRADQQIKFGPTQTIRTVRPSGVPTTIALPSVPHGMPGKKRARVEDDETEEQENIPPASDVVEGSPSKKLRFSIGQDVKKPSTPRKTFARTTPSTTPGSAKKGGISLSRLNFLSRPKHRAAKS